MVNRWGGKVLASALSAAFGRTGPFVVADFMSW